MKRIEELDFTRIIAMIAVITIHVTSAYIGYQSNILVMGMNVAFILNQLVCYASPTPNHQLDRGILATVSYWISDITLIYNNLAFFH